MKKIQTSGLVWLWVTILVIVCDQFSKALVQKYLIPWMPNPITSFFNLTLAYNRGAAFSFLDTSSGWQRWFFSLLAIGVSIGLIIWLAKLTFKQRWISIALCCIIGGAIGNFLDRIRLGHVIDFIQVHALQWYFPAFNIADSAIFIGACMLIWETFYLSKSK